ncbi:MAG: antibiotic biosynthesis monooxygenase family protein [Gammaproteobacteria bacterium]
MQAKPPYYAVIFSNLLNVDAQGYAEMASRMSELAQLQPGYLGMDSVRDGLAGITVSYWRDEASIAAWRDQWEHAEARRLGRERWYQSFELRVARVERAYDFDSARTE